MAESIPFPASHDADPAGIRPEADQRRLVACQTSVRQSEAVARPFIEKGVRIIVSPHMWLLDGPGREHEATLVIRELDKLANPDPDPNAAHYAAADLKGSADNTGEPYRIIALMGDSAQTPETMDALAYDLAERFNSSDASMEIGVRLQMPPVAEQ